MLFPCGLFFKTLSFGFAILSNLYANILALTYSYPLWLHVHAFFSSLFVHQLLFSWDHNLVPRCLCWPVKCYQLNLIVIFFWIQLLATSLVSNLTISVPMHIKVTCIHNNITLLYQENYLCGRYAKIPPLKAKWVDKDRSITIITLRLEVLYLC